MRHVPAPYTPEPLDVRPPLRILGLIASPRGLPPLDVDAEQRHLAEALAEPVAAGLVELVWVTQATWGRVHAQLLAGEWHVLHFVGHGDYDSRTDEGILALVGADGRADLVEASKLADLLGEAQPTPRLVVLNSCSSGEAGAEDLFSGTAAALVRSGINAVAAMQFTVSDDASIAFARGFYTAIAHGRGVDEAARSGRISILGAAGTLEWITPVLYLRGEATHLFTLTASAGRGHETTPEPQPSVRAGSEDVPRPVERGGRRRAELRALYVEARAEMRLEHYDTAIALFDDLLTLDPDYPDAANLRDIAERGRQLTDAYTRARTAEDAGDWTTAIDAYTEILNIDPTYRDTAARKGACETRQRVTDLQAELRHHAGSGQWQAVVDVDEELTRIDPTAADPDGLASRARSALESERRAVDLDHRYTRARTAEDTGDWTVAIRSYEEILNIDPTYRDTAARKGACETRQRVADLQADLHHHAGSGQWQAVVDVDEELTRINPTAADPDGLASRARSALESERRAVDLDRRYTRARTAEDTGDWVTAIASYTEILNIDPTYRDTAARCEDVNKRQRVTALLGELQAQAHAKNWPAVLTVGTKIAALDPSSADPDGLVTRARRAVKAQARRDRRTGEDPAVTAKPRSPAPETKPSQSTPAIKLAMSILWVLVPVLSFGLLAPVPVAYAAVRLRDKRLWLATGAYTVLLVATVSVYVNDTLSAVMWLALVGSSTAHLLLLRRRVFGLPSARQTPAGGGTGERGQWAPDPTKRHQLRYWDGQRWTHHVADNGQTGDDQM